MSDIIAFQCIGAKRERIVKSHGNARHKNRPYLRVPGKVRREATTRAATEQNAQRLVEQVRLVVGPEATAFEKSAAEAIIKKVREELGNIRPPHHYRHNMAIQMMTVQSKYYVEMDVPHNNYFLNTEYSNWRTQVSHLNFDNFVVNFFYPTRTAGSLHGKGG